MITRFDFSNHVVVVTGAAVGFGRAIAEAFAASRARTYALDRDADRLAAPFGAAGVETRVLDITDRQALARMIADIEAAAGAIDVLVNNAGGALGRAASPIETVSDADWDMVLDANVNGSFAMSRAVAAGMKRRGRGRIVNITSSAGLRPSLTGVQAYTTAKHALHGLTRHLAAELGPFGITVNAVAPGLQPVAPNAEAQWGGYSEEKRAAIVAAIPLRRLGTPQDIANAVMFFASDLGGYVTGQILPVSGGSI